jgi:hypothetical protein
MWTGDTAASDVRQISCFQISWSARGNRLVHPDDEEGRAQYVPGRPEDDRNGAQELQEVLMLTPQELADKAASLAVEGVYIGTSSWKYPRLVRDAL